MYMDSSNDLTFSIARPFGPSIGKFDIPDQLCDKINQMVDDPALAKECFVKWSDNLVGEVSSELLIKPDVCMSLGLTDFLARCTQAYINKSVDMTITKFDLLQCWIVRQYSGEYNPTHWHTGHISGAGWLKVPEGMTTGGVKTARFDGMITFTHGSRHFLADSIHKVEPKEGLITIFPNYLMHHVYPFNVPGERRSIAFNARVDEEIYNVYGH
jgi:hypothetical protein